MLSVYIWRIEINGPDTRTAKIIIFFSLLTDMTVVWCGDCGCAEMSTAGLKPLQPSLPFIHVPLLSSGVHSARRALHTLADAAGSLAAHSGLLHAFSCELILRALLRLGLVFLMFGWRRHGRPS